MIIKNEIIKNGERKIKRERESERTRLSGDRMQYLTNISTVLYFFNVPPPRAINGDVPLLETVPLLFQPHFRGMLPWPNSCQTHTFQGFFAGTDTCNEFTQCAYNGD